VGGHEPVKRYFRSVMRDGRLTERAPSGVLFAGPPGTGKTYLAQAIAAECGMTLVSMGAIRSKFIGDSERNLSRVLDVVTALAPIVVFVDEIDQALGRRDEGQHLDSGVSGRIFSQIMEFMGDPTRRGQVLWIAATNRADLLDAALLRRLQRVFPFLLPAAAERESIIRAIAAREPERYAADVDWTAVARRTHGASGAALELVLSRAREIAGDDLVGLEQMTEALADYKPNADPAAYRAWSHAALQAATFYSDWPSELPEDLAADLGDPRRR
jgi:SpoVK/Ycf46/Vps4 family AAA+-type ATPase